MTYVTTEKSITFIINGEMYVCNSDDERYDKLKSLIEGGTEKEVLEVYNSKLRNRAKRLLNGLKRRT